MKINDASPDQLSDFGDISLQSTGAHLLFGDIDTQSIKETIEFIIKANRICKCADQLTLFINTPGGSLSDGFALIDVMQISRLPVKTFGLGMIMSMGVYILAAGHKGSRAITRNTDIMAHQFWAGAEGKHHELMAMTKVYQYAELQTIRHFKNHSTMSEKQIRDILFSPTDRYLTPAEAKKLGLVDVVVDQMPEDAAVSDFFIPQPAIPILSGGLPHQPRARTANTPKKKTR